MKNQQFWDNKGVETMDANSLAHAKNQAKVGVSDIAEKVRDISEAVSEQCKSTYRDAERNVRKLRIAAEEGVHDTRKQIKSHPLAAVAMVASGAFLLGGLIGRLTTRR
jgi:ElaB/YqjD/DUF883 family membrane-anchored ribosome-binding protein